MPESTPNLSLYLPGGGSTGLITPDEVADIDRLVENFRVIDDFAGTTDNRLDALETPRNRGFVGPAADKAGVTGMRRGDTYQETDGTYPNFFVYDGTSWKNRTRARAQLVSVTSVVDGTVTLNWSGAAAGYVYEEGQNFWESGAPTNILAPLAGRYRLTYNVRTNGAGPLTVLFFKGGVDQGVYGQASGAGVSGAASHAQKTFDVVLAAADTLQLRVLSTAGSSTVSMFIIEYLGEV